MKPGRKAVYSQRLTLTITDTMLSRIDAALAPEENRLDFLRDAINELLEKRGFPEHAVEPDLGISGISDALVHWQNPSLTVPEVSKITGISASTLYRRFGRRPDKQS